MAVGPGQSASARCSAPWLSCPHVEPLTRRLGLRTLLRMNRRDFVGASVGASVWPALAQGGGPEAGRAQVFELRRYLLRFGHMEARFADYLKGVLIPALNRAGVTPVGAFSVVVGPDAPAVHLLLPHPSAESLPTLAARIAADPTYRSRARRRSGACRRRTRPTSAARRPSWPHSKRFRASRPPAGPSRDRRASSSCGRTRATTRPRASRRSRCSRRAERSPSSAGWG